MNLHVASLFSGIGLLDHGLHLAGMPTGLLCESDKHARSVLTQHYPGVPIHDDVRTLTSDHLRDAGLTPRRTVLAAGFPCQDISVAGRRKGMGRGTRSGLYWQIIRLLAEFPARWVLLENVPGLLSSHRGRDMGAVIGSLGELGYGLAWRVLDAQYSGVPQRRRRVVIVGHFGAPWGAPAEVLFDPEGVRGDSPQVAGAGPGAAGAAAGGAGSHGHGARGGHLVPTAFHLRQNPVHGDVSPALGATSGGQGVHDGVQVRRLTPLECERLQGAPDQWTAGQSDSRRYIQLGNAVAVPVFRWVGERIVTVDNAIHPESGGHAASAESFGRL